MCRTTGSGVPPTHTLYAWQVRASRLRLLKYGRRIKMIEAGRAWNVWYELLDERQRMQKCMRRLMNLEVARFWDQVRGLSGV